MMSENSISGPLGKSLSRVSKRNSVLNANKFIHTEYIESIPYVALIIETN